MFLQYTQAYICEKNALQIELRANLKHAGARHVFDSLERVVRLHIGMHTVLIRVTQPE